jgi:DNA-binding CsgD family transcriptional regulator
MICAQAYSELLSTLYVAPLDDARWQLFLNRLCDFTHSAAAVFVRNDRTLGHRMLASGGSAIASDDSRSYDAADIYTAQFRKAFLRNPRVGVIEGRELISREEWIRSAVCRTAEAPLGIERMTCILLSLSTGAHDLISLWRGPERPMLEQEYKELLTMLVPHLQNAIEMRHTLGIAEERARNAEAMLNGSAAASVLLDGAGRVLHMNDEAQQLILAQDGLCLRSGQLLPMDRSKRAAFAAVVSACSGSQPENAGGALALNRAARDRPLHLLVTPVRLAGAQHAAVRVLVLITDPERSVHFPDATLRQLYGLTPAETEIANGLLNGSSLDEIAQFRGVSVATVRSQMKGLMGKTDTQRQGDLVRLLSTLPRTAPARSPIHG